MEQIIVSQADLPPLVAVIRVGFGVPYAPNSHRTHPLRREMKRLEAHFEMPFDLQPFALYVGEILDFEDHHRYCSIDTDDPRFYAIGEAIAAWINTDTQYRGPCNISLYKPYK